MRKILDKNKVWIKICIVLGLLVIGLTVGDVAKLLRSRKNSGQKIPKPTEVIKEKTVAGERLQTKKFEDQEITVSKITPGIGMVNDSLTVYYKTDFDTNKLIEIYKNAMYVVNAKKNIIEKYTLGVNSQKQVVFSWVEDINLPKQDIGIVYGISCDNEKCRVLSAHHPKSNCLSEYNLATEKFRKPECTLTK